MKVTLIALFCCTALLPSHAMDLTNWKIQATTDSEKEEETLKLFALIEEGADLGGIKDLVEKGADINALGDMLSYLGYPGGNRAELPCRFFGSSDGGYYTPLMLAAKSGNAETCQFLTEKGANVHAVDKKGGYDALTLAAKKMPY